MSPTLWYQGTSVDPFFAARESAMADKAMKDFFMKHSIWDAMMLGDLCLKGTTMNNEDLKQTGLAMIAHAEGRRVQVFGTSGKWYDCSMPDWNREEKYRVKPEPKLVPWTLATCPLGAHVRFKKESGQEQYVIVTKGIEGCFIGAGTMRSSYRRMLDEFEMLDGKPCGTLE